MDTRLTLETARDRLDDTLQGLAVWFENAALPIESAAYLAAAQRHVGEAVADLDRASRHLAADGEIQRIMSPRRGLAGTVAIVENRTGELVR